MAVGRVAGTWAADAGIDLVAEDRDGGLWAVQAKHYDPAYAIKKADLDSFLRESSRPQFTYRLLIASHRSAGPTRAADARPIRRSRQGRECCCARIWTGARVAWPIEPALARAREAEEAASASAACGEGRGRGTGWP